MINLTGYKLTFDDEFNSLSVSQSGKSTVWADIRPDWRLNANADIGFGDSAFVDPGSGIDPFSIRSGALNIQAVQTSNPVVGPGHWASGLLESQNSFSQEYGYFEIRAQLPAQTGVWPAFWMLPENDSWPPEIDVFEAYGTSDLYQTVHTGVTGSDTYKTTWSNQPSMLSGFHTYGVMWTPSWITFYFDGNAIGVQSTPTDLHQPMYLLIDLAMQAVAGVTSDPKSMQVDYVRAYSNNPNAKAVPLGAVSSPDGLRTANLYGATAAPPLHAASAGMAPDILWQYEDAANPSDPQNGAAAIWLMNGTTPASTPVVATPQPSWHAVATGDFDGDGNSDIVWQYENAANSGDPQNGAAAIWLMNGTTPTATPVVAAPPAAWHVVAAGDFDGDGKSDLLWQYEDAANPGDPQNGDAAIWLMNGTAPTATPVIAAPGPDWRAVATGDFDGDGKSDILWQYEDAASSADPQNGNTAVWLMDGTTPTSESIIAQPGPDWHAIGTGDYDGDGKSDIVWQYENTGNPSDPQNGAAAIWLMDGTTATVTSIIANPPASWHIIPA